MFPIKEEKNSGPVSEVNANVTFESIDQFSSWLDEELDALVCKFAEFETDNSVRKFFTRS